MKHLSIFLSSLLLLVLCACGGSNSGEVYKNAGLAEADTLLEASYNAFDNNNFAKAQEYGEKALAIYTEAGDTLNQRDCYTHLCACYMRTSDAEKAMTMGFKALHIDSLRQDHEAMGSEYNNIAAVYLSIKDNDNARKFIDLSLEMDRVVGDAK
jgi:tetratricopeptide (TPR) repeat protein